MLRTLFDPTFKGDVAIAQLERKEIGELIPKYFTRATGDMFFDQNLSSERFYQLMKTSSAETLAFNKEAPPLHVSTQEILNTPFNCGDLFKR